MYKVGDRVVFHHSRKLPKGTIVEIKNLTSIIEVHRIKIKYDEVYYGEEFYEDIINPNRKVRFFKKLNSCNLCHKEEEISIDETTDEEVSNLIRVCIDKQENDYEYFCDVCLKQSHKG